MFRKVGNDMQDLEERREVERLLEGRDLDEALNSDAQQAVSRAVGALPEEQVSLAWRSRVNEAIASSGRKPSRQSIIWRLTAPLAGLAAAGALAIVMLSNGTDVSTSRLASNTLERDLIQTHRETVFDRVVAGKGLAASEAEPTDASAWQPMGWQESDVSTL
jgi:hypothetical protein